MNWRSRQGGKKNNYNCKEICGHTDKSVPSGCQKKETDLQSPLFSPSRCFVEEVPTSPTPQHLGSPIWRSPRHTHPPTSNPWQRLVFTPALWDGICTQNFHTTPTKMQSIKGFLVAVPRTLPTWKEYLSTPTCSHNNVVASPGYISVHTTPKCILHMQPNRNQ